jgi:hypothetical protein
MSTVLDYTDSLPPVNMNEGLTDLDSIKRQIRIARLKLGSILDAFDRTEASPFQLDAIAETTGDVANAIDRLVEELSAIQARDDDEI